MQRRVAEQMRQDPGFNVNMRLDGNEWTLLHHVALVPPSFYCSWHILTQTLMDPLPFIMLVSLDAPPVFVRC